MASPKRNNHRDRMARIMAVSSTWTAKPMRRNPIDPKSYDAYWRARLGGAEPAPEVVVVTGATTAAALTPAVARAEEASLDRATKAKITRIKNEIKKIDDMYDGKRGRRKAADVARVAELQAQLDNLMGAAPAPTPEIKVQAVTTTAVNVTATAANNAADSVEAIRLNIKAIEDYYKSREGKPGRPPRGMEKGRLEELKAQLALAEKAAGAASTAATQVAGEGKKPKRTRTKGEAKEQIKKIEQTTGVAIEAAGEAQAISEEVADIVQELAEEEGTDLPIVDSVPEPLIEEQSLEAELAAGLAAILEAEELAEEQGQSQEEAAKAAEEAENKAIRAAKLAELRKLLVRANGNKYRSNSGGPLIDKAMPLLAAAATKIGVPKDRSLDFANYLNGLLQEMGVEKESDENNSQFSVRVAKILVANMVPFYEQYCEDKGIKFDLPSAPEPVAPPKPPAAPAPPKPVAAPAPVIEEEEEEEEEEDTSDEDTADSGFNAAYDTFIKERINKTIEKMLGVRSNRSRHNRR
jgi:hypothetical protein